MKHTSAPAGCIARVTTFELIFPAPLRIAWVLLLLLAASATYAQTSVSVTVSDADAGEAGPNAGQFTVSLDAPNATGASIAVNYSVNGTATEGTDYQALDGTAIIGVGESSALVDVIVVDDNEPEEDETVELALTGTNSGAVAVGDPGTATITIADNDEAEPEVVVSVVASDGSAAESPLDDGAFTINASPAPAEAITVQYSVGGSATAPGDYTTLSGEVTLGAGETSASIPVEITGDDNVFEGDETVVITLTDAGDATIGTDTAIVTIEDSEYEVTVSTFSNANEDPVSDGEFRISLGATNQSGAALTVDYNTAGAAVAGSDYQPLDGTATIPEGASSVSVGVVPLEDDEPEDDESVTITLTNVGDDRVSVGSPASATVFIMDGDEEEDTEVIVSVTATDNAAAESPQDSGQFLVERVGGSNREVTIAYDVGGSATPGDDYDQLPGSITLAGDQNQATITMQPGGNDDSLEGDETVTLTLLEVADEITVNGGAATVTIADSSHSVTATRLSNAAENPLSIGRVRVLLDASNDSGSPLTVDYDVGGSASPGDDFEPLDGSAAIAEGARSTDIDVTPIDDDIEEGSETVVITLTGTSNPQASVGEPASADLVITDGGNGDGVEEVVLSISAPDNRAGEGSTDTGEFLVRRVGGSDRAVTVDYSVSGSATPVDDYVTLSGSVSLAEGQSEAAIAVDPAGDDDLFEGDETVVVQLVGVADEISIAEDTATVTIGDSGYFVTITSQGNASENPASAGELLASLGAVNQSGGPLTVEYTVAGSATPGTDYQALDGAAVIATGSSTASIIVNPLDDDLLEPEEIVEVTLTGTSDSRVSVGDPSTASITIADDDSGEDDDGDGVANDEECPDPGACPDSDGNGVPDFQDPDDDGDGIPTAREGAPDRDTDGNGTPDYLDDDDDGDGRPTAEEDENADGDGDPSTNPTDLDGDGVPDYLDADDTGGPAGDIDGDGLTNEREARLGTDPQSADTDGDGVGDGDEVDAGTDPLDQGSFADVDGDLVPDTIEASDGTDPNDAGSFVDSDGGGTADHIETVSYPANELPAGNAADANDDPRDVDGDGLPDRLELFLSSDPGAASSPTANGAADEDGDGVSNAVESYLMTLGVLSVDPVSDLDRDGYPDAAEVALGLDPLRADARDGDSDGVPDIVEALGGMDIDASTDSDGDGVPDAREIALGADPLNANDPVVNGGMDGDGDGVSDAVEAVLGALDVSDDPDAESDNDGDGITDADEIRLGTDPLHDEQPVPWIELRQQGIGRVNAVLANDSPASATAVTGGHQVGTLLFDWSDSDTAVLAVSSGGQSGKTLEFTPRTLPPGNYQLVVNVERTVGDYSSPVSVVTFPLIVLADAPASSVADADGDGIADSADNFDARTGFANELPAQGSVAIQAEPGLRLQLGSTARGVRSGSARVTPGGIAQAGDGTGGSVGNSEDEFDYASGIYDFELTALPEVGAAVQVVIPQATAIGEFAEYRKFQPDSGWFGFVENESNTVASAAGSSQGCPAPGDSSYEPGLTEGHFCVQLTIEDGGPNDADADLGPNGIIKDPGGVATPEGEVVAGSGSGRSGPATVGMLALLVLLVEWRRRSRRRLTALVTR